MKILMLTPYLPYPLISGGQIRSYNLLKNLTRKHQITLISLIKNDSEKQYIDNIQPFCHEVIVAKRPEKPWTLTNISKTIFSNKPFLVVRNFSDEAQSAVIQKIHKERFDLIHAETFYVMPHIPETKVPILLVEQTIEYLVYQHFVDTLKYKILRPFLYLDVHKIRFWEEFYWKRATRVVAMSDADKKVMQSEVLKLDVSIVPNGIDMDFFSFKKKKLHSNARILFVGNFKWLQNREAVSILVKEVWPSISNQLTQARLWIAGRFPTPEIESMRSDKIEIADNIDDIRQAYQSSDVLLTPIYGPGGTRYKILEAMASGLPVVTTPQGIEGLGVTDGNEVLVRTTPKDLAYATVELLTNQKLYTRLADSANQLVRKYYNWVKIANELDKLYEEVAYGT